MRQDKLDVLLTEMEERNSEILDDLLSSCRDHEDELDRLLAEMEEKHREILEDFAKIDTDAELNKLIAVMEKTLLLP